MQLDLRGDEGLALNGFKDAPLSTQRLVLLLGACGTPRSLMNYKALLKVYMATYLTWEPP